MVKSILAIILVSSSLPLLAQEQSHFDSNLQDSDYANVASKFWGKHNGGWEVTPQLKQLITDVDDMAKDCSNKLKWVPKPMGLPPGASALAKYALELRTDHRNTKMGMEYLACVKTAARNWKSEAERTQIAELNDASPASSSVKH